MPAMLPKQLIVVYDMSRIHGLKQQFYPLDNGNLQKLEEGNSTYFGQSAFGMDDSFVDAHQPYHTDQ